MAFSLTACSYCKKDFLKDNRHINENRKLGNNSFCSPLCLFSFRSRQVELRCENPQCGSSFKRSLNDISEHNYCSRSCAVAINNTKSPKKVAVIKKCNYCGSSLLKYKYGFYCSHKCSSKAQMMDIEEIINEVKLFYKKHGRVPVKKESHHYSVARKRFGTWNNAIIASGFRPNPVLFADRCISKDGHICDSIAEMLIDDYLYERKIFHERTIPYPEGEYTVDFKIKDYWIEYFGLAGEHKRYDELRQIKINIAKKHKLALIEIYPKDLYPKANLEGILEITLL